MPKKTERQIRLNKIRAAMKQVRRYLSAQGHELAGVKRKALIRMFADAAGYLVPKGIGLQEWLIALWESRADASVAKAESGFYLSDEWLLVRNGVLNKYGWVCMKCGSTEHTSVDHIKPRSLYPELELAPDNLQVLCRPCNSSKSNRVVVDYRGITMALEIDSEAWAAFVEMRKAKGKRAPFTEAAAKRIRFELGRLNAQGYPPGEVLWQSVVNGWSGVFPLKAKAVEPKAVETWKPEAPLSAEERAAADKVRAAAVRAIRRVA